MSITASQCKQDEAKKATPAKKLLGVRLSTTTETEKGPKVSRPVKIYLNGEPLVETEQACFHPTQAWKKVHVQGQPKDESITSGSMKGESTSKTVELFENRPACEGLVHEEVRLSHSDERALRHATPAKLNGIDKIDEVIKKPETFSDQQMAIQARHILIESGAFAPQFPGCVKDQQETSEQALERWLAWKANQTPSMRATAPEFVPSRQLQKAMAGRRLTEREPPRDQFVPKTYRTRERAFAVEGLRDLRKGPGPCAAPSGPFQANLGQLARYTILKREK